MDIRQAITLIEQSELTFRNEVHGHQKDQMDATLLAYRGEDKVGKLDYSVYRGSPAIKWIDVYPSVYRQGVGTALVKRLQAEYPTKEIDWGMMTDDGDSLRRSLKMTTTFNARATAKLKRLKALQDKEQEFQQRWGELERDPDDKAVQDLIAKWNDLNDAIYALERELQDVKTSTTLISQE